MLQNYLIPMLISKNFFSVRMGNFISPPPLAAEIIEHFLIIISLGINTDLIL